MPVPLLIFLYAVIEVALWAVLRSVMAALLLEIDAVRRAYDLMISEIKKEIFKLAEYLIIKSVESYLNITIGDTLNDKTLTSAINQISGFTFTNITDRDAVRDDAVRVARRALADALEINESSLTNRAAMVAAVKRKAERATIEALQSGGGVFSDYAGDIQNAVLELGSDFVELKKNEADNETGTDKEIEARAKSRARQARWRAGKSYTWQ